MKLMSTDSCWKPFWKTPVRKALKDENNFSKAIPDRLRIPSHNKRNLEEQGKRFWGRSKRQVDQTRLYLKPTFSCLGNPTVLATKAACGHPIIKNWKKNIAIDFPATHDDDLDLRCYHIFLYTLFVCGQSKRLGNIICMRSSHASSGCGS